MASKIMPTPEVFSKAAILKTYRNLLRATYIAFQGTWDRSTVRLASLLDSNTDHSYRRRTNTHRIP